MKKRTEKKPAPPIAGANEKINKQNAAVPDSNSFNSLKYFPIILCILLGIYYGYIYSVSEGLYQQDEAGHMMEMLFFWDRPLDIMINLWSRGGYKILYSLSTLGGVPAIIFTNILFTCGAAYLSYLIAKDYGLRQSWLAIIFFGLQPFIINLSFRCYAEVPTMFFSVLLLFLYNRKKYFWIAIVASFLFTLRQEMGVFAILLGLLFIYKKKWLPFLLLAWAPLALGAVGWYKTGDAMYLVNTVIQGGVSDTYQRNGFFYLWLMLPEIIGSVLMVFFVSGYISLFLNTSEDRKNNLKKFHGVLILFTVYFLMHCIFTSKSFGFGRSGGLGRFLIVISPCIAIISQVGFHFFSDLAVKIKTRLIVLAVSLALMFIFLLSIDSIMPLVFHSFTVMKFVQENFQFLLFFSIVLLLLILLKAKKLSGYSIAVSLIILLGAVATVKPLERNTEDETIKSVTDWYWTSPYFNKPVHAAHAMFSYYSLMDGYGKPDIKGFDSLSVVNANKGELFLYENHYSGRLVSPTLLNSSKFILIKQFNVPGSPFNAYFLEKQ